MDVVWLLALPFLVFAGLAVAESLQDFFQKKADPFAGRARGNSNVMRIHRALYEQLDRDVIQLLASSRDFDSNGALSVLASLLVSSVYPAV